MTQIRLNAARLLASAASVVLLALAPAAQADTLQDISKLIKQGQHAQALEQVDKYLAGKPKDAQGRFLKGIVLTEMNKPNEAIAVFSKLTEDFPELPEPYNNLAVIYAQQKQFDKAKQALEMAIRTHPPMPPPTKTSATSTPALPARPTTRHCRSTPRIPLRKRSWR
jgi:Flp pilus assembly protein TadD